MLSYTCGQSGRKLIAFLIAFSVLSFVAASTGAVMPPAKDVVMPAHVAHFQKEMARDYGSSGIALRLQSIKKDKAADPKAAGPVVVPPVVFAVPVILGSYSDNANIFTAGQFQTQLFGANPTGSMSDYYTEVSYSHLNLTGTVYGPFAATGTQAYYVHDNNGLGNSTDYPTNAGGFVVSLLTGADPSIDFSLYDNDGADGVPNSGDDDGFADALIVVFPDGDASAGDNDNIWAHQWQLSASAGQTFVTNDSKSGGGFIRIDVYTVQAAEKGNGTLNQIRPIGVFCHEFGHVLGLPDLYDYDGSSEGIGNWCLMSGGSWGASGSSATEHRPVHMTAWCKAYLGWLTPTLVTSGQTVQIPPVETDAEAYKLWEDAYQGGRYFLLENRTKTGFDADLPGEGVALWHCNDEVFFSNDDDAFRLVDMEEADGANDLDTKANGADAGDLYPGSTVKTSFTDATNPSALDVFGVATGVAATSFADGPGSDVTVTLAPRELEGFTMYQAGPTWLSNWGFSSSVVSYGAMKFTASGAGDLMAIQAGLTKDNPMGYTVRIFNDMVANSPSGLLSTTSGTFPSVATDRYSQVSLSTPVPLSLGQPFVVDVGWGPVPYAVPFTIREPISGNSYFSGDGANYTRWTDKDVAIRARIRFPVSDVADNPDGNLPDNYRLAQNYPNPFNPETVIGYSVPKRSAVELAVFNLLGQKVRTLVNRTQPAGDYTKSWDGTDDLGREVASGVYLYRLTTDNVAGSRKMMLLK
jgi:M6 family metalloprotease-like protein